MQSWVDKAGGDWHTPRVHSQVVPSPPKKHMSVKEALEAIGLARQKKQQQQQQKKHVALVVPKVSAELPVIQDSFPEDHPPKMVKPRHTPPAVVPKGPPPVLDPIAVEAKAEATKEAQDMATIRRTGLTGLGE